MTEDKHEEQDQTFTQKIEIGSDQLIETVKELFNDSTAKRVTVRTSEGKQLLSVPLTVGMTGGGWKARTDL